MGMSAVTITQFIILICAMIMLTLRAAFYEVVDESELVDPRRCLICCARNRRNKQQEKLPCQADPQTPAAGPNSDAPILENVDGIS
jgi:hypothetical protein